MSMISDMTYLNVRHQLPSIGIRQQHAKTLEAGFEPAVIHTTNREPVADVAASQVKVNIDTYECRKQYGFLNNADFRAKIAQEGLSNAQEVTSKHARQGWDLARNGARSGVKPDIQAIRSEVKSICNVWPTWTVKTMPPPTFTVEKSEIKGQMDPGTFKCDINPTANAKIRLQPGSAETYLKDKGFINRWVTKGYIDTQA